MGLLTNPSLNQRSKFGRTLIKHNRKLCFVLYIAGLVWFVCLGHPDFNHSTYLSENALSPGLVYSELKPDSGRLAQTYLEELKKEREDHRANMPYAWIQAKMKQIGLETHVHNFTLNYPFGGGKVFQGKNVYGILRAPRIGSTEGIVFSAPYRPPNSVHADITASVPLLLAFADFARRKNYWAKDLIFLVTEQEQLGVHAWLEAYYGGGMGDKSVLNSGNLPARAGALQAALNLEIQDFDAEYIDVKIEGLNGQLPNLDMFNLVQRLAVREGISSGYKQIPRKKRKASQTTVKENLKNILAMIASQANGVPTGNHGLFHRHRIESLTLEAVKGTSSTNSNSRNIAAAVILLKTVEGISRSLNNLLERFHQSYFFYILVQNDRFISIGDFMPCLALMAGPLYIKAFLLWLNLNSVDEEDSDSEKKTKAKEQEKELPYIKVLIFMGMIALLGTIANLLPLNKFLGNFFAENDITTPIGVTFFLSFITVLGLFMPFFIHLDPAGLELLHVGSLLALGSALLVIGLLNFALGFFIAVASCPLAILINTKHGNSFKFFTTIYTFLLNPLVVIYLQVLILTMSTFNELSLGSVCLKAFNASMDAITYGLVDSIIYGNWLFTTLTSVCFPIWVLFWSLNLISDDVSHSKSKKLKMK
ncbi:glycosylphosphatidylinositol anchor attachment 1 protein [Episyrphus balteatus]|uniref:glycosylphosphatidylinositol anchor attachment 1 protein n=1 Tax=Episyrphus balteatus TaxID=286459 RepID=UPI0024858DB2|nr:glycosylphosphatidylinositol anchor attachment 1 protein [Episyrphus balteatus]